MRRFHTLRASLVMLALSLLVPLAAGAQDAVQINYQGFLTDDAGSPLTNVYAMVFTVYDVTGGELWSESHPYVTVTEGGFHVILGSVDDLPSSLFGDEPRYLGIQVGEDPEISPRTLLTSVPGAASARRLTGDIETGPGSMVMKTEEGLTAVVMVADPGNHAIELHPPDPCVPPDPCAPALELIADAEIHSFKIHPPEPCTPAPCDPSFEFESGVAGVSFSISDGSDRMGIEPSPTRPGYSLMMYNPASIYPTEPKFEVFCGSEGTGFDIWDDIGKVMGTAPSPFNNGHAIKLFDPTAAVETPIVEISSFYGDGAYGKVNVGWVPPPDDNHPGVELTSTPSHGKILIGGTDDGTGAAKMIVLQANAVAQVGIGTDTPSEALHVVGNAYITGDIYVMTDTKVKSNVLPIDDALNRVDQLEGVTYYLQGEIAEKMGAAAAGRKVGFLAHNVEQVLPEAVKTMNDGYKAVDYSRLTALLVEAVKELKTENEALRSRVEALEGR